MGKRKGDGERKKKSLWSHEKGILRFSLPSPLSFFPSLFTQPLARSLIHSAYSSIDPIGTEGRGGEARPAFLVGDAGGGTMRRDMSRVPKCPRRAINWNSNGHKHLPAPGQCQQDAARSRGRTPLDANRGLIVNSSLLDIKSLFSLISYWLRSSLIYHSHWILFVSWLLRSFRGLLGNYTYVLQVKYSISLFWYYFVMYVYFLVTFYVWLNIFLQDSYVFSNSLLYLLFFFFFFCK